MSEEIVKNRGYVQHFSTRIPWKDNGFTGKIDDHPKRNVACQIITNIAEERDIDFEEEHRGKEYVEVGSTHFQHWITENAAFMSEKEIPLKLSHPYADNPNNEKFTHYVETDFTLKPYSFLLRPFSWTLIASAKERAKYYHFYFDAEKTERMLDWPTSWVSHGESQKGIFDYFFSGIKPHQSLIFPYYKQVPFVDDPRRVIAGMGTITDNVQLHTYETDGSSEEKNYIWETNVPHSIREDGSDGFLMPYDEIMAYAKENPDFDVSTVTLFEPPGFREQFSYAAEWVSYDAAIALLNQAKIVLKNIAALNLKKANGKWVNKQLDYIDNKLENIWQQRGIYPGLGSMLSAFGVKYGYDIAKKIPMTNDDFFTKLGDFFSGEKVLLDEDLDDSLAEKEDEFFALVKNEEKAQLFELLSRINLSFEQAQFAWETFKESATPIIENPYLLFELSRKEKEEKQITISHIDYAMFPHKLIKEIAPLQRPTRMRTESDKRRFRALVTHVLVEAVSKGHTLLTYEKIVEAMKELPLEHKTNFTVEKIEGVIDFLSEGDLFVEGEHRYIKLHEYKKYKEIINQIVRSRTKATLPSTVHWQEKIDEHFGALVEGNEENDRKARKEKADALQVIESSKLSVFIGRAGTGKTTALSLLGYSEDVRSGGILALTPTGKARVQLENAFKTYTGEIEFKTVAQFLIRSGGFSWDQMTYRLPTKQSTSLAETVIIDESSMLTEEMFASMLKLVDSHAKRIIFVGDPNQLPPIGAGRPFFDLINYLKEHHPENVAELETEMRQGSGGDDLAFAKLFSDAKLIDKDIINKVRENETSERLTFIQYDGTEELEEKLFDVLVDALGMKDVDDVDGFNESLGATKNREYTNYPTSEKVESWQILSPTKFVGSGSFYVNNIIHDKYRQDIVDEWNDINWSYPKPQSIQQIVFGDKVISNTNGNRTFWDGSQGEAYIANGEIGIMCNYPGQFGWKDKNKSYYKFRFGSFEGKVFSYTSSEFGGEERDSNLELAYALTVHKAQGSGFDQTIVVINGKSAYISKELLYTAFSRQENQLIILSDISVEELLRYSTDWYSDTKQRFTDLFALPDIEAIEMYKQKRYFEKNLIHRTSRGEFVRSKSEVIVANLLYELDIDYVYEEPLRIGKKLYLPDFTLRHEGRVAYLEHLGMLRIPSYKRSWEKKQKTYEEAGISEEKGNLLITEDGLDGSLDTIAIRKKILAWVNGM